MLQSKSIIQVISSSIILVLIISITSLIITALNINQIDHAEQMQYFKFLPNYTYLNLVFLIFLLIGFVFILFLKKWAFIMIYSLLILLIIVLLTQAPIDWINIGVASIIAVFLEYLRRKTIKSMNFESNSDNKLA